VILVGASASFATQPWAPAFGSLWYVQWVLNVQLVLMYKPAWNLHASLRLLLPACGHLQFAYCAHRLVHGVKVP
jgi:hypothetical protein